MAKSDQKRGGTQRRNIMIKVSYVVFIVSVFALTGCSGLAVHQIGSNEYLGYKPIDPLPSSKVQQYDYTSKSFKECYWAEIVEKKIKLSLLSLQSAKVAVSRSDASGKVSYLPAAVTGESGSYQVTMDYMKYRIEDVNDRNGQYIGNGHVGVGLRIKANVVTKKANINLGGISAIGLEAKQSNLTGNITVDVVGIDSPDVTNLIPLTSEIDQTSIQNALQALASIKSKLWDDTTTITPHFVALQQAKENAETDIRSKITSSQLPPLSLYYLIGTITQTSYAYQIYETNKKYFDLLPAQSLARLDFEEHKDGKLVHVISTELGQQFLKGIGIMEAKR